MTWTTARDAEGRLHQVVETLLYVDEVGEWVPTGCAVCGPQDRDDGKCQVILDAEQAGPY